MMIEMILVQILRVSLVNNNLMMVLVVVVSVIDLRMILTYNGIKIEVVEEGKRVVGILFHYRSPERYSYKGSRRRPYLNVQQHPVQGIIGPNISTNLDPNDQFVAIMWYFIQLYQQRNQGVSYNKVKMEIPFFC